MNKYFEHRRRMLIDSVSGGFRLPFTYYDWKATPTGIEYIKMFNPQETSLTHSSNAGLISIGKSSVNIWMPWDNSNGTYSDMKKELRNFSEIILVAYNYQGISITYDVTDFSKNRIIYTNTMKNPSSQVETYHIPRTALGSDYDPSYGIQIKVTTYSPATDVGAQIHKIIIK